MSNLNTLAGRRFQREHTIWGKADEYSRLCHAAVFVVIQRYGEDTKRVYHSHYDSDWPNLSWPEMKEYGYPKVIAHTPESVRARRLRTTTLAHDEDEPAEEAASKSDNNAATDASSCMETDDEEGGAGSDPFDIADYLMDASDPDATEDEAGPGPATAANARVASDVAAATSGPQLGSSRPLHLGSTGRMPESSVPSGPARTVMLADSTQKGRCPDPVTPEPPNPATQKPLSSLAHRRGGTSAITPPPIVSSGPALGGGLAAPSGGFQAGIEVQQRRVPTIFQHQAGPHTPSPSSKPVYGVPSPLPDAGKYGYDERRLAPVHEDAVSPSVLANRRRRRLKEIPELGRTPGVHKKRVQTTVESEAATSLRLQRVQRLVEISRMRQRGRLGRFEKTEK